MSSGAIASPPVIACEILRQAAELGPEAVTAVHAALLATRPELVPAELPATDVVGVASAMEAVIRERFRRKSRPPEG